MAKSKFLLITQIIISSTLIFSGCTSKNAVGAVNPLNNGEKTSVTQTENWKMLKQPYLQAATTNSIYVLVETDSNTPVTVQYGETKLYGKTSTSQDDKIYHTTGNSYVHHIKLADKLTPNTLYHYRVAGGLTPSSDSTFKTAKESGTNVHYAVIGDSRSDLTVSNEIVNTIINQKPDFVLSLGDVTSNSDYTNWEKEFLSDDLQKLMSNTPLYNTPGNHEGIATNTQAFTQVVDSGSSGDSYSFDYGDTHFVMLNNENDVSDASNYKPSGEIFNWVNQDISSTKKPWKIFAAHKPIYTADAGDGDGADSIMESIVTNILEPMGVSVYFAGHNHFYQRNLVNGINHIISGGAGAKLYTPVNYKNYTQAQAKVHNYLIVDETPKTMTITAYDENNKEIDKVTLTK